MTIDYTPRWRIVQPVRKAAAPRLTTASNTAFRNSFIKAFFNAKTTASLLMFRKVEASLKAGSGTRTIYMSR